MVSFRPLGDAGSRVFQSLFTLDNDAGGVRILIDVGWDSLLSSNLAEIEQVLDSIDLILLTHATIAHIGAFCKLRIGSAKFRSVPCYATLPVITMGQMLTIDAYRSAGLAGPFFGSEAISAQDIEAVFYEIHPVKYSQPLKLTGIMSSIEITAYNAGHTLGGAMWKITDGVDTILYASDWNHARDAHLSGAFLEASTGQLIPQLLKPSLLVSTCPPSLQGLKRSSLKLSRQQLLDSISQVLKAGGTVLLPTSSGSRVLELILVVGQYLAGESFKVPLIYASHTGAQTLQHASSMLEWMVGSVITDWQVQNDSPFDVRKLHHVRSAQELVSEFGNRPKVVLATGECLESGLSTDIFVSTIASDPASAVILTEQCTPGTLGHRVVQLWIEHQKTGLSQLTTELPQTKLLREVSLEGAERKEWEQAETRRDEEAQLAAEMSRRNQEILEEAARGEQIEEDEEDDEGDELDTAARAGKFGALLYDENTRDIDLMQLPRDGVQMIPFVAKKRRADEYGEPLPSFLSLAPEAAKRGKKNKTQPEQVSPSPVSLTEPRKRTAPKEAPVKLERHTVDIRLLCFVSCIDLNGLTNARSMEMVVRQASPNKLLLLPDIDSTTSIETASQLEKAVADVRIGNEPIEYPRTNFSVDLHLDPTFEASLSWKDVWGGYKVARASGTIEFAGRTVVLKPSLAPDDSEPITIGDVRLSALKRLLEEQGVKSNFKGKSVLACAESSVSVERLDNGHFRLEGGVEPEYYIVRSTIEKFLALI